MKSILKALGTIALLIWTWGLFVLHFADISSPQIPNPDPLHPARSKWISKDIAGIHQLVLEGNPYERGELEGKHTHALMALEERELITQIERLIPNPFVQKGLSLLLLQWFWGANRYLEPWMTLEMLGVSRWGDPSYDRIANPFLRQVAYHAIHEIGQMMVDQGYDGMGCTVAAYPFQKHWVIGRNFDFEGGRIFDSEKIMKWVFPDQGYAFVSIIWAGMVGAVTGVNEHGVYLSINAAGSTDFRRLGTPSTLVLLKALQFSKTAQEAVSIIEKETMFITDIFVVSDSTTGDLFRIEKSPDATAVIPLSSPSIITNHLISKRWENDKINLHRKNELTSTARLERGDTLLLKLNERPPNTSRSLSLELLKILRDKGEADGHRLYLGNRKAIDALIATHSVIYDQHQGVLYVGKGPAVSGAFMGYDLNASFSAREPKLIEPLPADSEVSERVFKNTKRAAQLTSEASHHLKTKQCSVASQNIEEALAIAEPSAEALMIKGEIAALCHNDPIGALNTRQQALDVHPPYPFQSRILATKIRETRKP